MSDNSSNPLDGLPTPQKAAKPSPLKSDPGHQPQQGERWWLQNSIKPEGEEPEAPDTVEQPEAEPTQQATTSVSQSSDIEPPDNADTAPDVSDMSADIEDQTPGGSSNLPVIIGVLVVIGLIAAFVLSGGES